MLKKPKSHCHHSSVNNDKQVKVSKQYNLPDITSKLSSNKTVNLIQREDSASKMNGVTLEVCGYRIILCWIKSGPFLHSILDYLHVVIQSRPTKN